MSKKIIGVTVGTPTSTQKIKRDLQYSDIECEELMARDVAALTVSAGDSGEVSISRTGISSPTVSVGENDGVYMDDRGIYLTNMPHCAIVVGINDEVHISDGGISTPRLLINGEDVIGDMETALDSIIAIQNALIGGESV
jgi:hypothetical protein